MSAVKKWTQDDEDKLINDMYYLFKNQDDGMANGADQLIKRSITLRAMAPDSEPMADYIRLHKKMDAAKGPKQLSSIIKRLMKHKKDDVKRSAKNIAFAYKHIVMDDTDKLTLRAWVTAQDGIEPKLIITGPSIKGMSLKAAKNYIGYLDSERMNMNKGYLRMLVVKYSDSGTLTSDDMAKVPDMTDGDEDDDDNNDGDLKVDSSSENRVRGLSSAELTFIDQIRIKIDTDKELTDKEATDLQALLKYSSPVITPSKKVTRGVATIFRTRFPPDAKFWKGTESKTID